MTSHDRPPTEDLLDLVDSLGAPPSPADLSALTIEANLTSAPTTTFTSYLTVPALTGLASAQAMAQAPTAGVPAMVGTLQGLICASQIPLVMTVILAPTTAPFSTLTNETC